MRKRGENPNAFFLSKTAFRSHLFLSQTSLSNPAHSNLSLSLSLSLETRQDSCYGCGAPVQTLDPTLLGYVDPEAALAKAPRRQRGMLLCARCRGLSHGRLTAGVAEPWMDKGLSSLPALAAGSSSVEELDRDGVEEDVERFEVSSTAAAAAPLRRLATPEQLRAELEGLEGSASLVALVVDCLDVPGSLLSGKSLRALVGKNPVFLIGTRADLLPGFGDGFDSGVKGGKGGGGGKNGRDKDGKAAKAARTKSDFSASADPRAIIRPQALSAWLADAALRRKLSVAGAAAVSSKTGAGVPFAAASLRRARAGRDVVVVGAANVGKSAFVRALVGEMRRADGPQFDAAAAGVARRLPVASAVPGTTLGRIALAAFSAGGSLVDTPGLHLHHRLLHLLRPEEVGALQPTGPLRARRPPAPREAEVQQQQQRERERGARGAGPPPRAAARPATYLWGGLARFDLELPAPSPSSPSPSVDVQFVGPAVLPIAALPLVGGEAEVPAEVVDAAVAAAAAAVRARGRGGEEEEGREADPSSPPPPPPPAFGRESVDARGGLRVSRVLDLKGSGLDVCISGLPGWLSLRPAEALTASTRTSSSSGGGRRAATSRNCQLEGRLTVWVPKGVEVFVRPPLPFEEPLMASAAAQAKGVGGGGVGGLEEGEGWWTSV